METDDARRDMVICGSHETPPGRGERGRLEREGMRVGATSSPAGRERKTTRENMLVCKKKGKGMKTKLDLLC